MPKILLLYLEDEWTYGRRAHRLVRANGFFVKESITSGRAIVVDFFSRVQILRNFPSSTTHSSFPI